MRKVYIVPNFVTTANMFCGFGSIISSIQGDYVAAAWGILAAAVFDALDGRIARLAKATSQFGVEYDSLSDLVSFGVAPGILLYQSTLQPFGRFGWMASFLFVVCGALRLARFNVMTAAAPKSYFQGLPIPGAAGIVATFTIFHATVGWPADKADFTIAMTLILASLMVSTIRFPSFKEFNWKSRASFGYLMVGVLTMILIAVKPEVTLFLVGSTFVLASMLWNLVRVVSGASAREKAKHRGQTVHEHGQGD